MIVPLSGAPAPSIPASATAPATAASIPAGPWRPRRAPGFPATAAGREQRPHRQLAAGAADAARAQPAAGSNLAAGRAGAPGWAGQQAASRQGASGRRCRPGCLRASAGAIYITGIGWRWTVIDTGLAVDNRAARARTEIEFRRSGGRGTGATLNRVSTKELPNEDPTVRGGRRACADGCGSGPGRHRDHGERRQRRRFRRLGGAARRRYLGVGGRRRTTPPTATPRRSPLARCSRATNANSTTAGTSGERQRLHGAVLDLTTSFSFQGWRRRRRARGALSLRSASGRASTRWAIEGGEASLNSASPLFLQSQWVG